MACLSAVQWGTSRAVPLGATRVDSRADLMAGYLVATKVASRAALMAGCLVDA